LVEVDVCQGREEPVNHMAVDSIVLRSTELQSVRRSFR
jgi:hypothetical protein